MANSAVDTPSPPVQSTPWWNRWLSVKRPVSQPFVTTLVLTVTLATAALLFLTSAAWVIRPPHKLPGILAAGGDQNQHTKTALYLCAFVIILPLALLVASRVTDLIAAGPNGPALDSLVAVLASSLAVAILLVRLSAVFSSGGTKEMLPAMALWGVAALALLARAIKPRQWDPLLRIAGASHWLWWLTTALGFGLILCVTSLKSISPLPLVIGLVAIAGLLYAYARVRLPRLSGRRGIAVDVIAGVLLLLAVPNLLIFADSSAIPTQLTTTGLIQLHQDFIMGYANRVLHGGVLMVNSPVSQYGVGDVYFLAGWFHLAPIGYGTYGFLDGMLTALYYLAAFCVVRIAGVRRPLAIGALALAVAVLVYNLAYVPGDIPQQGPLRFGMPMLMVLASVIAARWPRWERAARAAQLVVLGIAAIWALEAFGYTLFTYLAIVCVESALLPAGERLRTLGRRVGMGIAACVAGQVLFAIATLVASGHLPDWVQYWVFVKAFLLGGTVGNLTYGFARWSPGVPVGGLYLASAAAVVLLLLRRPQIAQRERLLLVAVTGTTAYGIALFSYFDNRSSTYLLLYVALPALLTATLWLSYLVRRSSGIARPVRVGALGFSLCLGLLLLTTAWPSIGGRFARTPLAEAFPGGHGLRADIRRLWHPPPLDPRAPDGEALLARFMPGQERVMVITMPGLGSEVLVRSKRIQLLPIADPVEQSFIAPHGFGTIQRSLAKLRPGQRILMDGTTWSMLQTIRAHPGLDPLKAFYGSFGTTLQGWLLQQLDKRFTIKPIYRDPVGFIVAELAPRS